MRVLGLMLLCASAALLAGGSADAAVLAHWSFDSDPGAGNPYPDVSGNGYNVNQVNSPAFSTTAKFGGGAVDLERDDSDYLVFPGLSNPSVWLPLPGNSFSTSFWAFRESTGGDQYALGQGDTGSADQSLHIGIRANGQFTHAFWSDDQNIGNDGRMTDTSNWHHWVTTYDATTNSQKVYIDGSLAGTRTANGDFVGSSTNDFWIGRRRDGNYFDGLVDEVWIFDSPLQPWEVSGLYRVNAPVPEPATLLVWSLLAGLGIGLGWRRRK